METTSVKADVARGLFGKIRNKMILGFLLVMLTFFVFAYFATDWSTRETEKILGEEIVSLTQETMSRIDTEIFYKIERFEAFGANDVVKLPLAASNTEFEKMGDIQSYIEEKDGEWIAAPKNEITPFMEELINNSLSDALRERMRFYEKKYGYVVVPELFVTNKYGAVVAESGKTSDYNQADEEWWQTAAKEGLYIGDMGYDESSGYYSVDFGIRVSDNEGNFLGVMKVLLNMADVLSIMKESETSLHHEMNTTAAHKNLLITQDKRVLDSSGTPEDAGTAASILDPILASENNTGEFILPAVSGGNGILVTYARSQGYKDMNSTGWILVSEHDSDEIFGPLLQFRNVLLLAAGVMSIIALVISVWLTRAISRPIRDLHAATLELQKGNYKVRTDIRTNDELEDLGKTFNETAERLAKVEEEHTQLDKAKTEFMSITSHELRSPMTPMKAQLQMLLENYFGKLNPKQRESAKTVLRNTERLDKIILDFLEISRIEAARLKFKFVRTDITAYIRELAADIQGGFMPEKKVKIEVRLEKLPEFEADPDRVVQVLRNLLTNAVKFSPQGGRVIVTARQTDDHVQISVQDFGAGMDVATQGRVFEPFFQAESAMSRQFGGTGLGLAICKGIVESQNGKIWFDSEPGKGTTFYFTVPLEPVREIKPIRILLSKKVEIENRIKDVFVSYLGPLGVKEFEKLQTQKGLDQATLMTYVKDLEEKKILDAEPLGRMADELRGALGEEKANDIKDARKTVPEDEKSK